MASSMDDLIRDIFPVRKTIDDAVDEAETLPFRYQKKAKQSDICGSLILQPAECVGAIGVTMTDNQVVGIVVILIPLALWIIYAHVWESGYERGKREGYHRGRAVNRQEFWQE